MTQFEMKQVIMRKVEDEYSQLVDRFMKMNPGKRKAVISRNKSKIAFFIQQYKSIVILGFVPDYLIDDFFEYAGDDGLILERYYQSRRAFLKDRKETRKEVNNYTKLD